MGKKSSSKFGDVRLDNTLSLMVNSMVVRYTVVLRQLGQDRSEEVQFGRFINNRKVAPALIISQHWKQLQTDFRQKHLLVVNDTSTFSFPDHDHRLDLGYVGPKTNKTGFNVHSAVLVDAQDGACYGLGGLSFYKKQQRTASQKLTQRTAYSDKGFEENERYKWFSVPKEAIQNCPNAAQYTLVGDRESDIYDLMSRTLDQGWDFLYRSKNNRRLVTDEGTKKLHDQIGQWPVKQVYQVSLPATKKRSAHTAKLELKYGQVNIARPKDHPDNSLPTYISLQVVQVKEHPDTVVDKEQPIHWVLFTSHPLDDVQQAIQVVQWYRWRWIIEQCYRTAKSKGLDVENSQVSSFHALANLTTLALIASALIMQLVQAREGKTWQGLDTVFLPDEQQCLRALSKKLEGRTKKLKNPHPPNALAFAAWVIARLGGWKGYKTERPPGPITMTRGVIKFFNILEGYYLIL